MYLILIVFFKNLLFPEVNFMSDPIRVNSMDVKYTSEVNNNVLY